MAIECTVVDGLKQHYLCEPLRSRTETPVKLSGPTGAGDHGGLRAATAHAFAHFSVIASNGALVFADLQGKQLT